MLILMVLLVILIWVIYGFFSAICIILYKIKINNLIESINSIEDLIYIHFKDLLNMTAEIFKRKGYEVKTTDKCGDEGYGLILNDLQYVEIWNHALNPADIEVAMKLAKCMQSNSISRGILVSLGDFKQNTRLFCHKYVIECISGKQLLGMCKDVQKKKDVFQPS